MYPKITTIRVSMTIIITINTELFIYVTNVLILLVTVGILL